MTEAGFGAVSSREVAQALSFSCLFEFKNFIIVGFLPKRRS